MKKTTTAGNKFLKDSDTEIENNTQSINSPLIFKENEMQEVNLIPKSFSIKTRRRTQIEKAEKRNNAFKKELAMKTLSFIKEGSITKSTLKKLNFNLKLIIFSYLPIEDSFHSLFKCCKAIKLLLLEKMKISYLLRREEYKTAVKKNKLSSYLKKEIFLKCEKYFNDNNERDEFLIRILKKICSRKKSLSLIIYENDRLFERELIGIFVKLLLEKNSIEYLKILPSFAKAVKNNLEIVQEILINNSLHSFYLKNKEIGCEGAIVIAETIKSNNSLKSIYVSNNELGEGGAIIIAEAIKVNNSLRSIYLDSNRIGVDGARAIAQAIRVNNSLRSIYLDYNGIGVDGARGIAVAIKVNKSLKNIELQGNILDDDGAIAIAEALKTNQTLQKINLAKNLLGPKAAIMIAEAIKANDSLQIIDLKWNYIGDEGAKAIAEAIKYNKSLKKLYLTGNFMRPSRAVAIEKALLKNASL